MKHLTLIQKSVLTLALAATTIAAPAAAAPRVLMTLEMTQEVQVGDAFIEDGAEDFIRRTVGARLQVLDDGTFVISGGGLPTTTGRYIPHVVNGQRGLNVWAKTDQIDLNGLIAEATDGSGRWGGMYWVQVNAPRTDGGPSPRRSGLAPASILMAQLLVPPSSAPGSGGQNWLRR